MKDVEIAYLVDPDSRLFASRSAAVAKLAGNTPRCVQDVRRALDDKSLDALSIAAPNHWHALMAIWACQAGKDVHVEKPCSHNVVEGRRIVEAARKYHRLVQHGTQRRSDPKWTILATDVRRGKYGRLRAAWAYTYRPRLSIGVKSGEAPPPEFDYNLWVGPAPMQPYRTNLVPYEWHWIWDFGNGEIGNLGAHQLDVTRWAMPADAAPRNVVSLGGRFGCQDQGQTPNTQLTVYDCGDVKLVCQQRGLVNRKAVKVTVEFHTDDGVVRPPARSNVANDSAAYCGTTAARRHKLQVIYRLSTQPTPRYSCASKSPLVVIHASDRMPIRPIRFSLDRDSPGARPTNVSLQWTWVSFQFFDRTPSARPTARFPRLSAASLVSLPTAYCSPIVGRPVPDASEGVYPA